MCRHTMAGDSPGPQIRQRLALETWEYHNPFNYENVTVGLRYLRGKEFHGVEMNPINSVGQTKEHTGPDTITIVESEPIVRVAVIGSACVPPGYVALEAEPIEEFYRPEDVPGVSAARFRIDNLWGMHMRADNWLAQSEGAIADERDRVYEQIPQTRKDMIPNLKRYCLKSHYRENPLVGMSCAIFEIPKSRKVTISGGSELCAWTSDSYPDDIHYSFRMIRITVATSVVEDGGNN